MRAEVVLSQLLGLVSWTVQTSVPAGAWFAKTVGASAPATKMTATTTVIVRTELPLHRLDERAQPQIR
jgi:hypothetical protein